MFTTRSRLGATTVAAAALFLSLIAAPALANKNPCHRNKDAQGANVTCAKVVVPPYMCAACRLKPDFSPSTGDFKSCRSIYDMTSTQCQRQLRYYADRNKKCDPVRWEQTRDFNNPANAEGLDYFLYTVCEQCCDCIPRGSKKSEWYRRKVTGTNLDALRGNCPAHGWYDICKIWPKVRFVTSPRGLPDDTEATPLCPDLKLWRNNPANRNWLLMDTSVITDNVKRFFERFFKVINCQRQDIWSPCVDLETAQGRL